MRLWRAAAGASCDRLSPAIAPVFCRKLRRVSVIDTNSIPLSFNGVLPTRVPIEYDVAVAARTELLL